MTSIAFNAAPRIAKLASSITHLLARMSGAVDRFAESRMRQVASECALHRPRRDPARYRRLFYVDACKPRAALARRKDAVDRASGKLKPLNTVSSGGAGPTFVSIHPSGRFALVANSSRVVASGFHR